MSVLSLLLLFVIVYFCAKAIGSISRDAGSRQPHAGNRQTHANNPQTKKTDTANNRSVKTKENT